jgi:hypothetical protein
VHDVQLGWLNDALLGGLEPLRFVCRINRLVPFLRYLCRELPERKPLVLVVIILLPALNPEPKRTSRACSASHANWQGLQRLRVRCLVHAPRSELVALLIQRVLQRVVGHVGHLVPPCEA